jgi:hypothetical protein
VRALRKDSLPSAALAACILGLVICPFWYIVIGAPFSFPPAFSFLMLPPQLIGSGYLLWRFLAKPPAHAMILTHVMLETVSWLAIIVFLIAISRFTLMTPFERLGLFCSFFLLAWFCCLPVTLLREIALEQRLRPLPFGVSVSVLIIVLMLSGIAMIAYLARPPAFI